LPRIDASKPGCPPVRLDHFGSPRLARDRRTPIITAIVRPIASQAISNTLSSVNHMHSPLRPSTRACLQLVMRSSTNSPAPKQRQARPDQPFSRVARLRTSTRGIGRGVGSAARVVVRKGLRRNGSAIPCACCCMRTTPQTPTSPGCCSRGRRGSMSATPPSDRARCGPGRRRSGSGTCRVVRPPRCCIPDVRQTVQRDDAAF
jgi:hypothetical protein